MSVSQISGLVSGLDTASLIDALVTSRSGPVNLLRARQAQKSAELVAWQSFEATVLGLKIETERLGNRELWNNLSSTTSAEEYLSVSADPSAAVGTYDFFVERLATAASGESVEYASDQELVGSGTVSITDGKGVVTDFEVGAGTTVAEFAELINEQGLGITATTIRSEAAGVESFRLVVQAEDKGAENNFSIDTSGLAGGTDPAFSVNDGQDAIIRLGGSEGIAIYSGSNTFTDVVSGVDVTVLKAHEAESTEVATVSIERDTANIKTRMKEFVATYNAMIGFVNEQYRFDPDIGERPPLMGNGLLTSISSEIRSSLFSTVEGLETSDFRTLLGVGLTPGANGTLSFNEGEFDEALDENFDAVANLFRANATFDDTGIAWLDAPADLDLGGQSLEIEITEVATRASITGSTVSFASELTIDETNDSFSISLDGVTSETLKIGRGVYRSGEELAAAIQEAIEDSEDLGALSASVTFEEGSGSSDAGQFVFTATKYGSAATIKLTDPGNSFWADIGLGSNLDEEAAGTDVVGLIGGELATGNGRVLIGDEETPWEGLSFRITADEATTLTASFTEGAGRSVARRLTEMTQASDGTIARITGSVQGTIDRYERDIAFKTEQLEIRRARLEAKYANLESVLGQLQSQGNFLSSQLSSLQGLRG